MSKFRLVENRKLKQLSISLPLLIIFLLSFIAVIPPVHAYVPTVANANYAEDTFTSNSLGITISFAAIGDTITVFAENFNNANASIYTITSVTSAGVSGGFTKVTSKSMLCVGA